MAQPVPGDVPTAQTSRYRRHGKARGRSDLAVGSTFTRCYPAPTLIHPESSRGWGGTTTHSVKLVLL